MPRTTEDGVPLIEGREYEVVGQDAHLSGMIPWVDDEGRQLAGNALTGWREDLPVGSRVVYTGMKMGWGSDSLPEHTWSTATSKEASARHVQFRPQSGSWFDSRPRAGMIRLVET